MEDILNFLRQSVADEFVSKQEKRTLRQMLADRELDASQLNFIRNKIFELANEKATNENFRFVLEWVKSAVSALENSPPDLRTFFSPGDECRNAITQQLSSAKEELLVCVFTISDDIITDSLLQAHHRGVSIRIITDNEKSFDKGSDIYQLAGEGIDIRMDTSPDHMHHKFMVVDKHSVLTGSYNWTRGAARFNHENIIITQNPATVKAFTHEFNKLWPVMAPFKR